jgi:hypothetical protein
MPSLIGADAGSGVNVAANYLKSPSLNNYADGAMFTNFGTRQMTLLKVVTSGGTNDLTKGADGANGNYYDANSVFNRCVRAMQNHAEIYVVGQPDSTTFLALVSTDTVNSSDTSSNVQGAGYGDMEADIAASMNASGAATVTASGTATNRNFFVGGAVGTFA